MSRKSWLCRALIVCGAAVVLCFAMNVVLVACDPFPPPPPPPPPPWKTGNIISISNISPSNNSYFPVTAVVLLGALVQDEDLRLVGGEYNIYSDDVTSGDTEETYHVKWSKEGVGVITDAYGTTGEYRAPLASGSAPMIADVEITVRADDFDERPDDPGGADDEAVSETFTLHIWQLGVEVRQNGQISSHYDGADIGEHIGGGQLGFLKPNDPSGTIGYFGATEICATIPVGLPEELVVPDGELQLLNWFQLMKGTKTYWEEGAEDWQTDKPKGYYSDEWESDSAICSTSYPYKDCDPRHPNNEEGEDTNEVLLLDHPGAVFPTVDNDGCIGPPDNFEAYSFDMTYRTGMWTPGEGTPEILCSGVVEWKVEFIIEAGEDGKWYVSGT